MYLKMDNDKHNDNRKYNKNEKKNKQSISNKPKKRNNKLTTEDKEKIKQYYTDLIEFYDKNNEKAFTPKYKCNYNNEKNYYYITEYDHQTFESFGLIKDKELILTSTEVWYLHQIELIALDGFKLYLSEENIPMFHLYSYLRRSGKIVSMIELISKEYASYLFIFETMNDYKEKTSFSLIYQYTCPTIKFEDMNMILSTGRKLFEIASIKNKASCPVSIAFCSGINITFISIIEEDVSFN